MKLEFEKSKIFQQNFVENEISQLKEKLSAILENSSSIKERSFSNLSRLLCSEDATALFGLLNYSGLNIVKESLIESAKNSKNIAEIVLERSMEQDKILNKVIDELYDVQSKLDDLEIQLDEFLKQEIRDMSRNLSFTDTETKENLDVLKEFILENNSQAETAMNIVDHVERVISKFASTKGIEQIREKIRENNKDDINKLRSEMQDKINQLEDRKSSLESEHERINSQLISLQAVKDKDAEILNRMSLGVSNKELEIGNLRNQVTTLNDEITNLRDELNRVTDENSDQSKEIRGLKKNLREKESDIRELNEKLELLHQGELQ